MCGSTCCGRLPAHHQEHTTALEASGFTVEEKGLERCWSWSARPRPTTFQPLPSNGKTRGFWYSCMLLMMGGETPETCWATHKRQVKNLWYCCILLVDLFESYDNARTWERQMYKVILFIQLLGRRGYLLNQKLSLYIHNQFANNLLDNSFKENAFFFLEINISLK